MNKLRVWYTSNRTTNKIGEGKNLFVPVKNIEEAILVIETLSKRDLLDNEIDFNAMGLEESEDEIDWNEYYNEDGEDINDIMSSKDNYGKANPSGDEYKKAVAMDL